MTEDKRVEAKQLGFHIARPIFLHADTTKAVLNWSFVRLNFVFLLY